MGGLSGSCNYYASISNSLNTGTISGTDRIGCLAGDSWANTFSNCYYYSSNGIAYSGNGNSNDSEGHYYRVYTIAPGNNVSSVSVAEDATATGFFTGAKYYKAGNWTVTMVLNLTDAIFARYTCEGGTLSDLTTADGAHTLTISGQNVTIGAILSSSTAVDMNDVTIADIPDKRWRNVAITPALDITYNNQPLVENDDYLLEWTDNTAIGTATATLQGINRYKGTVTKTFNIVDFELENPNAANSASNPYLIATEEDLQALASQANTNASGRRSAYYKQTADITLTEEHTPIGHTYETNFQGVYDGDNNKIINLFINRPNDQYQGLFGYYGRVNNCCIQNVILENCDITGGQYTGGIAGYASGREINNCVVSGEIKGSIGYYGGIAGYLYNSCKIQNCINKASVTGSVYCGGIVGCQRYSEINNSINIGTVTGTSYVGSIVGKLDYDTTLSNNYHTANTTGGVGAYGSTTGTDQAGAETIFTITAGNAATHVTLPNPAYTFNETGYYKSGTKVTLSYDLPVNATFASYEVNSGTLSDAGVIDGQHTLSGATDNVVITGTHVAERTDFSNLITIATIESATYKYGNAYMPEPVVTLGTETLVKNTHYTLIYGDDCINAGEHTVTVMGMGIYCGSKSATFNIDPYNISGQGAVSVSIDNPTYNNTDLTVTPTVKRSGVTLEMGADKDYTITIDPSPVHNVGEYTMSITGQGNYTGTRSAQFQVIYAVPTNLTCTASTATTATIGWTENGVATSWKVEYSLDQNFATSETVTVNTNSATLEGLLHDIYYYARVKAVYGADEESDWSATCKCEATLKMTVGTNERTIDLPLYSFGNYSVVTQQLYTKGELGNKAGTLIALDFHTASGRDCGRNIEVYLTTSTQRDLGYAYGYWVKPLGTKVYDGWVNFPQNQWCTITFDTPFEYDGNSDLVVTTYVKATSQYADNNYFWSYAANNQSITYHTTNTWNVLSSLPTSTSDGLTSYAYKNCIRLYLVDKAITLANDDSQAAADATNSALINANNGKLAVVTLDGRTLYKDGDWNTLCLPFDVTLANSPLAGATVKKLTTSTSKLEGSTLTLNFEDETTKMTAGTPYLVKWTKANDYVDNDAHNLVNPVFRGVTIDNTMHDADFDGGSFKGTYSSIAWNADNQSILFLGAQNKLYWPKSGASLGAQRAYFQLNSGTQASEFVLNFDGESETTGIISIDNGKLTIGNEASAWYTVNGVKLDGKPNKPGLYINNGRKVVIK